MTVKDMHYDFKLKLNKLDSQQNKNLIIPEIDWLLNKAQEMFIELVAEPRIYAPLYGFDFNNVNLENIKTIIVRDQEIDITNNNGKLPDNYMFYIRAIAIASKGKCRNVECDVFIPKYKSSFDRSVFDTSSFEWRSVNALFSSQGIDIIAKDFEVHKLLMTYLRQPKYIHYAEGFRNKEYKLPSGKLLKGQEDCELPLITHSHIVNIAVMLASGQINSPEYQNVKENLRINKLI